MRRMTLCQACERHVYENEPEGANRDNNLVDALQ